MTAAGWSATAVAGDGAPTATIDEQAFLARIERTSPQLDRIAAVVEAARADVVAAGIRAEPTLSVEREEVFPDGGLSTNYARLDLPLDVSGRRGRRVAAATAAADAAAAESSAARVEVIVASLRVFYEAAHARLHVDVLRGERDALVRAVDIVRKRTGAGAASGYDLRRFELELAQYDDLLVSAETELLETRTRLAALLGRPDELVDASSTLDLPKRSSSALPSASVLEGRGDYRAAKLRARSADRLAEEGRRGWVPSLGLSVGVMSQDVGDQTAVGYTAGLTFSLPVFDRGRATAARAGAARRAADADARALEASIPAAVRARRATLDRRLAQAAQLASGQLSRLPDLLRSAETAYREGSSSVVELLDAYQTARDARLRDLELRRDARLAELDLWLVLGQRP